MNKLHYLAAVAIGAMTLASCSNDEVISSVEKSQAISFDAMANKTSRAEVTTNGINRFRVFGCAMDNNTTDNHVVVFNDVTVSRPDGSTADNWTYDNTQYWAPNKDYYFVALSTNVMNPAWSFTAPTTHPGGLTVDNFLGYGSVSMDLSQVNAENDLVYSYASRATDAEITNSTKVPFTFHHMLSRLGLKFTNAITTTGYNIKITNVKIAGVTKSGEVNLGVDPSTLAWNPSAETIEITATVPNNAAGVAKDGSITSGYKFIIPSEQTFNISFDVEVLLNGVTYSQRSLSGTIAAKQYKPGCSYMLNASITIENIAPEGAKPIEFTVTAVDGWGNDEEGDIIIN